MQEVQAGFSRAPRPFPGVGPAGEYWKPALPGLLAWVLRHNTDITLLHSLCGGFYTEAALKYLIGKGKLRVAHLKSFSNSTIQMLSMCTSLAICTLYDTLQKVDLDCLKSMHTLVDLKLSLGTFAHVPLTRHITGVTFTKACVVVDAIDAACGLKHTFIFESEILGLDGGICMLTCLRRLWCCCSAVHTSQAACKLNTDVQSETDLHGLTALTQLDFLELCIERAIFPSLEHVYALQSLDGLRLTTLNSSIHVAEGLSKLSRLTSLEVQSGHGAKGAFSRTMHLSLAVEWDSMCSLQILHINGAIFEADNLVKLTELKDLREVDFTGSLPADRESVDTFC